MATLIGNELSLTEETMLALAAIVGISVGNSFNRASHITSDIDALIILAVRKSFMSSPAFLIQSAI